jgi:hypothetical protein
MYIFWQERGGHRVPTVLSVLVNTQPRSAPLRLFFFCWVCYSVAIKTVFQAYLTTFLIEPGYEEPIKTVEQMLTSDMKFGFLEDFVAFFDRERGPVESAILDNAVKCPDLGACLNWAALYQNMSILFENLNIEICRDIGNLRDQNNRPLLCELEDGGVVSVEMIILVYRGNPLLELINDIIDRMVESGIVSQIKKKLFSKENILSMPDVFAFNNTYAAFDVSQLQTAFCLLMLGYLLALACFVTEIMWHRRKTKGLETKVTFLCHGTNA